MRKFITANVIYEATHNWPQCDIQEVSYLKHEHRHNFYINLVKEINHNDRDLEFIVFKHQVEKYLKKFKGKLGRWSCEDLAETLLVKFNCKMVSVLEDNENGAIVQI